MIILRARLARVRRELAHSIEAIDTELGVNMIICYGKGMGKAVS